MDLEEAPHSGTVVCTLGMHRSGTSVVSRVLNLLGVHLGAPQYLSRPNYDNPKGHWEHHPLALLNDEILSRFGGSWDAPPAFPASWRTDPRLDDLKARARELLTEHFAAEPLWGWKDPRTCVTLPFWQDLIGPMRYIICLRNPCAVVASLGRRNGMGAEQAERLWLTHVQASLTHTSGEPRMFVFYEDIINDVAPELRRLKAFIGRPERGEDPCVCASVREFLDQELCHHRMSVEDLASDRRISFATKSLYLTLRSYAPRDPSADEGPKAHRADRIVQATLELLTDQAIEAFDRTAAVATMATVRAERDHLLGELHTQTIAIAALSSERDDLAATVGTVRDERDQLTASFAETRAERDRLAGDASTLTARTVELGAECQAVTLREHALAVSVARLESALRELGEQRATVVAEHHAQAAALAGLSAERDRLAIEADVLVRNALALSAEVHQVRTREQQVGAAKAQLESELRAMTTERAGQEQELEITRRTLHEIQGSCAWRLVTCSRRMIVSLLPAGTRRRRVFNAVLQRLAHRADIALRTA